MKAKRLYEQLEKDFIKSDLSDEWSKFMGSIEEFLSENFKKRSMGLVCDFTEEVNKVYTAVFPSNSVLQRILDDGTEDAMLFVHHPSIWDIRKAPEVFQQMDKKLLARFKERRISIYNLHVPLDNYGDYSTSTTLAKAIGINPKTPFAPYFGSLCGIFGDADSKTIDELKNKLEDAVNHEVKVYEYGDKNIKNQEVAVIAGGGNDVDMLKYIADKGVNTFVTGITAKNDHSKKAHEFAEKHKINVIGGTHYSTETFACMEMVNYFKNLGISSEFIQDVPIMEDM